MGVQVDERVSTRLRELRKKRFLSQEELRQKAKVSLRTVQNIEKRRRGSFSEATLIALCRALDVPYDLLWTPDEVWSREVMGNIPERAAAGSWVGRENEPELQHDSPTAGEQARIDAASSSSSKAQSAGKRKSRGKVWWIVAAGAAGIVTAAITVNLMLPGDKSGTANVGHVQHPIRMDWVDPHDNVHTDPARPGTAGWTERINCEPRFYACNYVHYNRTSHLGDSIHVEFQWSWYYEFPAINESFLSAYAEWDPDREVRLFHGDLSGEGTRKVNFMLPPPPGTGAYSFRIFYVEAFATVPSFYGAPPPSQVTFPGTARHTELTLEVLP